MVGIGSSKHQHWKSTTLSALRGLAGNFPSDVCLYGADVKVWGQLTPQRFPCQKSDTPASCPGWSLGPGGVFAAPGSAQRCPCLLGRQLKFGPLLDVAHAFGGLPPSCELPDNQKLTSYIVAQSQPDLLGWLMQWLWFAAINSFAPQQSAGWIEQVHVAGLTAEQRLTLRWWSRLIELSGLVQNERYTVFTGKSVEQVFRKSSIQGHRDMLSGTGLGSESFVVLVLSEDELTPTGFHSEKNTWLESFLSVVDELCLGLCMVTKQPLVLEDSNDGMKARAEYRWKARRRDSGASFSLQQVLRRGAWDRLCEALMRGDDSLSRLIR